MSSVLLLYAAPHSTIPTPAVMMQALFTVYGANFPLTFCLFQMLFTGPVCAIVSGKPFDRLALLATIPLGLVNCANIVSGLMGTGGAPCCSAVPDDAATCSFKQHAACMTVAS
jgi:hypothetical protein